MRCQEILGVLSDYIDDELEARLCAEIEMHMRECPDCQVMVDTVRKTVLLYRTRGHTAMPAGVQARLYAVLDLEKLKAEHD